MPIERYESRGLLLDQITTPEYANAVVSIGNFLENDFNDAITWSDIDFHVINVGKALRLFSIRGGGIKFISETRYAKEIRKSVNDYTISNKSVRLSLNSNIQEGFVHVFLGRPHTFVDSVTMHIPYTDETNTPDEHSWRASIWVSKAHFNDDAVANPAGYKTNPGAIRLYIDSLKEVSKQAILAAPEIVFDDQFVVSNIDIKVPAGK